MVQSCDLRQRPETVDFGWLMPLSGHGFYPVCLHINYMKPITEDARLEWWSRGLCCRLVSFTGTDTDTHGNFMTCHSCPWSSFFYRIKRNLLFFHLKGSPEFRPFRQLSPFQYPFLLFILPIGKLKNLSILLSMVIISGQRRKGRQEVRYFWNWK